MSEYWKNIGYAKYIKSTVLIIVKKKNTSMWISVLLLLEVSIKKVVKMLNKH